MLTSGKLNGYLFDINGQAEKMFSRLVKQIAECEGMTERLKLDNQMEWIARMNNIRNRATEIVNNDFAIVYYLQIKYSLHIFVSAVLNTIFEFYSYLVSYFENCYLEIFYAYQTFVLAFRTVQRIIYQDHIGSDFITDFTAANRTPYPFFGYHTLPHNYLCYRYVSFIQPFQA